MQFPSFGYAEIHPSVALSNDKEFRSLRRATAVLGGSAKPFEKGLSENFKRHRREVAPINQNLIRGENTVRVGVCRAALFSSPLAIFFVL